jgi:beta-galactosidase
VSVLTSIDWPGTGPNGALLAGRRDTALIVISIVDKDGIVVRNANNNITVTITGPGELIGLGNGDHQNHLPGQGITSIPAYKGFARAIIRSRETATGMPVLIAVDSDGLISSSLEINVV